MADSIQEIIATNKHAKPHGSTRLDLMAMAWSLTWMLCDIARLTGTARPTRAEALRALSREPMFRAEDARKVLREEAAILYALGIEADAIAGEPKSRRKSGRGPVTT